jgi:GTPase SAR1 family protein
MKQVNRMIDKSEQMKTIKVLLIGAQKQKDSFKTACGGTGNHSLGINIFTVCGKSEKVNYQIWDSAGQDKLRFIPRSYTTGFQAFIYFDITKDNQAHYENVRDGNTCIAFDFNALNLEPLDFLNSIDEIMQAHQNNIKDLNQDKRKAELLIQTYKIKDVFTVMPESYFPYLPMEITQTIIQMMFKNHPLFTNPHKPIYIALPAKPEEIVEPEKNNCIIQ